MQTQILGTVIHPLKRCPDRDRYLLV